MVHHGVLSIAEEPTCAGMAREGFGGGNDPVGFVVGCDEELTGAGVGQFVALEFAADVVGVFGAEVVVGGAVFVGPLDDDSLRIGGIVVCDTL